MGERRGLTDVYLWAQRRSWPVPPAVRSLGRRLLDRTPAETIVEPDDWARPLVGTSAGPSRPAPQPLESVPAPGAAEPDRTAPAATVPSRAGRTAGTPSTSARTRDTPSLRCVVATGVLDVGGMDNFVAFLGRRLPAHGLTTTVLHTDTVLPGYRGTGGRLAAQLRAEGMPIAQVSRDGARAWLGAHRPDVISAHGAPDWLLATAAELGIPIVETLHRSLLERESWEAERVRSRQITAFVAVSELARRQYLVANPTYPAERVITIPNGVDDQHIGRRDRAEARAWLGLGTGSDSEFLFVSFARYCLQKNPSGLLAAFSEVAAAHPRAHLVMAGRADDAVLFEQVRRLRDRLPGAERMHLRTHCPDPAAVLEASDAFVLDSFFEGWPLATMEALFSGLPVVMSEVGGAVEQVGEDGRRGYVVPNPLGDPAAIDWRTMAEARFRPQVNKDSLVAAMCRVVAERDHWVAAREQLRAESASRFSADTCVASHADVLVAAATGALAGPVPV